MKKTISLVIFNETTPVKWTLGKVFSIDYSVQDLLNIRGEILKENSDYILFWDANTSLPTQENLVNIYMSKGNLWHVGSKIGLQNKPTLLDGIQPTEMLHVSIDHTIDHSSWKNTFKGCLLEKRVFEDVLLSSYSNSLDIIGLDFGYKAVCSGVITRYSYELSKNIIEDNNNKFLNTKDEFLFIKNNFDKKAFFWTYIRSFYKVSPITFFKILNSNNKSSNIVFKHKLDENILKNKDISTSVVIATLERYPFLVNELKELRELEIPLKEIIIVDQTPEKIRSKEFLDEFKDLPIIYIETNKIGQCSARNKGIEKAKSKFIWFLDDDMQEIPKDYLNRHLKTLHNLNADISCGIPDEIGTQYIERSIPKIELSSGMPMGDTLVKRDLLLNVNGFDEKMDQLQSEDQEIGLRCVKQGALNVKNNQLRIIHLRASRGGLRNHNVRKITFASSRNSLFQRRFLHYSEIYLNLKHFSKEQVNQLIRLNIRGTFIVRGNRFKKIIKIAIGLLLLPHSFYKINKNLNLAKKMFND